MSTVPRRAHTGHVAPPEQAWSDEVSAAAIAGDRDALGRLFREAQTLFGEQASHKWSEAMSGLDASAQTG
jgi:hypothetical protein